MPESPRVLFTIENYIAYVTLNRADKHNGLDMAMFRELIAISKKIRKNRSIRCVILSGNGPSFCSGVDFKQIHNNLSMIAKIFLKLPWTKYNVAQEIAHCWHDLPVPVISVIHGHCFGGGLQIILATDYRIARADAQLSIMEIKWGLVPDMSGMVNISRLTRIDIAQELTMTGRKFTAQEGHDYGLISQVADHPMQEAIQLATRICQQSPDAVAATKYLFRKTWKEGARKTLRWERRIQAKLIGRKNQRIAMQNAFKQTHQHQTYVNRNLF